MRPGWIAGLLCVVAALPHAVTAQQRVTLGQAVDAALAHGLRVRQAQADEATARAAVSTARAWPNPTASLIYSEDYPTGQATVQQPLELPWLRAARIRAARAGARGAAYQLEMERAEATFSVDSAYVQAVAAARLAAVSARVAREAAEVARVVRSRRNAGRGSDLDVEMAVVQQGEMEETAVSDSLDAIAALLRVQALMGLPSVDPRIVLADSLEELAAEAQAGPAAAGVPLRAAAAEQQVQSQRATLVQQRAARISAPAVMAGVEWHDPGQPGYLPTFGISIPLPFFDRNQGDIAAAQAALLRAEAGLEAARRESAAELAAAEGDREAARLRAERGRRLLAHAERVMELSLQGYRDGTVSLDTLLDAQSSVLDARRRQIQNLAALRTTAAALALARRVGSMP
jgi:cobalt-zinc-cadmium efflux system outer membrane protein